MKTAVTGCAGFIGSHLADYLLERGHEVLGIDSLIRGNKAYVNSKVKFFQADIRDSHAMNDLLKNIDWVFHTAAVSTTPWAMREPVETNSINVSGTLTLLESSRKQGVKRFVLSSSNVVYGASTPYKISKLAAEGYTEVYSYLYDLSTISLRYSNVFGSLRQCQENCIMSMRTSALQNRMISVTGDGTQSRDFTNVKDICRANVLAASSDVTDTIDICTGNNRSMNEIASLFNCPVQHVPDRAGDIKHINQDPAPAMKIIGFKTEIPFEQGIKPYLSGMINDRSEV